MINIPAVLYLEDRMKKLARVTLLSLFATIMLTACDSGPGAKAWCWYMDQKDKTDWSASDASNYAKRCLFD
jgi:hypothetical protein